MRTFLLLSAVTTAVLGVALPEPNPAADPGIIIQVPTKVPEGLPDSDVMIFLDLSMLVSQTNLPSESPMAQIAAGAVFLTDGPPIESLMTLTEGLAAETGAPAQDPAGQSAAPPPEQSAVPPASTGGA